MSTPKLLIVGDFATPTGFARVTESLAACLRDRWDIAVLAVNYRGDAHPLQAYYRLYPAHLGGDGLGVGRITDIVRVERPDVILVVNDPWIAPHYLTALGETHPPCVLYTPVDASGLRPADVAQLNGYTHVIAYTHFGAHQLAWAGYTRPIDVIPHGIDTALFQPVDQALARQRAGLARDTFAVLVLDRNQPRKRLDVAFAAFAQFAADKPANVHLIYHGALDDLGWDIEHMAADLDISHRLGLTGRWTMGRAMAAGALPTVYSMCDVKLSTTAGEGWGLTTMEGMACGLPSIVPDFAALGEWARGAVELVPATIPLRHPEINTVGCIPTIDDTAQALERLYQDAGRRAELRAAGLALVQEERYQWPVIATQFDAVLRTAMSAPQAPIPHTNGIEQESVAV